MQSKNPTPKKVPPAKSPPPSKAAAPAEKPKYKDRKAKPRGLPRGPEFRLPKLPLDAAKDYHAAYANVTRVVCDLGGTLRDCAEAIGITEKCFYEWTVKHKELAAACTVGKGATDDKVEMSLLRRATGYSYDAEKIFYDAKTGNIVRVAYVEHVPPETVACIFWLKNRRPKDWRQNPDTAGAGNDDPVTAVRVTVVDARKDKK